MPNIAAVLKEEIRRLAKKEIKAQVGTTKKAVAQYRSDIANLKRSLSQQEREIKLLKKQQGQPQTEEEPLESVRFSARSVKAQRSRLGLSAADYGKLVGVVGLDHLQLGTRQVPSPQGPTCCLGCRSWHWQEGSVDEVGGIDAEEGAGEEAVDEQPIDREA